MILRCPRCRKKLSVPERFAGKGVRCPSCNRAFNAPRAESAVGGAGQELDLENLAALERDASELDRRELEAVAQAASESAGPAAPTTTAADPMLRTCPECGHVVHAVDAVSEVLCSNCWQPIPAPDAAPAAASRKEPGLLSAGGFYANIGSAIVYPFPALSSLVTAAVVAFAAALVPVVFVTALSNLMQQSDVGTAQGVQKADLTLAQVLLISIFAGEILFFSGVALHMFLDVIRTTVVGNDAPPSLQWSPAGWGHSLVGYLVLLIYTAVAVYVVLLLTVEGDLPAMLKAGRILEVFASAGPALPAGLILISFGVPMNLVGLGLGSVLQAVHPGRVLQSIVATHVHYCFLVLLLGVYGILFGSAFGGLVFDWFTPKVGQMSAGSIEGNVLGVAAPLAAWGVVMALYFYGSYVLARLHGLFARAFRRHLRFGTT